MFLYWVSFTCFLHLSYLQMSVELTLAEPGITWEASKSPITLGVNPHTVKSEYLWDSYKH